jgi:ABC-type bacteriocin/lantibiotic exporters, contain an N-terminal double-glycine peptidase domain
MHSELEQSEFQSFLKEQNTLLLAFTNEEHPEPMLIIPQGKEVTVQIITASGALEKKLSRIEELDLLKNAKGEITFYGVFTYASPISLSDEGQAIGPMRRLLQLLSTEKKEIFYILFYAVIIGFVSLILPLGIQTTVELVSGGVIFSSVYVMIGLVIVGVAVTGVLQIVQISLVEFLQRRIFTKAAFEFAFRIPRLRLEMIQKSYAPELINRFFDVITIQKGLPKLLIDLSSAVIQILFGLLLISLYHPFFVFFGLILLGILFLIFYFTGPKGLASSIQESKYKYKVAQWLEELARALPSFKMAGNTDLPIRKTDYNVNSYLKYRKAHFNILVTQFSFIVIFKALITGGLLIMGALLVVDRQITLGQFVAAEVIIILILNAVEKIIMYMDVVYDLLTAVDKVSHVTDLPIEKTGGFDLPKSDALGLNIKIQHLSYRYPGETKPAVDNLTLSVGAGESLCVAGPGHSGKTTLANILAGFYDRYEGIVTFNNYSLHDLDATHLRDQISKNISHEDLFDGTILENLTLGKNGASVEDVHRLLSEVGLIDSIQSMPDGLNTHILSGGKGLTQTFSQKLILCRCLVKKPRLMIFNNFFHSFSKEEKKKLLHCVLRQPQKPTLIAFSNDPMIMGACNRVIILDAGKIKAEGKFDQLLQQGEFNEII